MNKILRKQKKYDTYYKNTDLNYFKTLKIKS